MIPVFNKGTFNLSCIGNYLLPVLKHPLTEQFFFLKKVKVGWPSTLSALYAVKQFCEKCTLLFNADLRYLLCYRGGTRRYNGGKFKASGESSTILKSSLSKKMENFPFRS